MSQLSIIKFGFAGEIAGANMPPPPEIPMGCQRVAWAGELAGTSPVSKQSPSKRRFKQEQNVESNISGQVGLSYQFAAVFHVKHDVKISDRLNPASGHVNVVRESPSRLRTAESFDKRDASG